MGQDFLFRIAILTSLIPALTLADSGSIAISPDSKTIYVTDSSDSVSVISKNNTLLRKVRVGQQPKAIVLTPDDTKAYVSNCDSNTVSVISIPAYSVSTIHSDTFACPGKIVITPNGKKAYVANNTGTMSNHHYRAVSVINTADNTVSGTITFASYTAVEGSGAYGIAMMPEGNKAYVTSYSDNISVIDPATDTVAKTIRDITGNVFINPNGTEAYLVSSYPGEAPGGGKAEIFSTATNTIIGAITFGNGSDIINEYDLASAIAFTPDGKKAYLASYTITDSGEGASNGRITVIDTKTRSIIKTIALYFFPSDIVIMPDGSRAYIRDIHNHQLSMLDTATDTIINAHKQRRHNY